MLLLHSTRYEVFRTLFAAPYLHTPSASSGCRPPKGARALAVLHHKVLDVRIAEGADVTTDQELSARAWQITRPHQCERLANAFDSILIGARRPRKGALSHICLEELEVARRDIQRLTDRLRDPRRVRPRGVALALQLLHDKQGPLHLASPNDELWRQVHRALDELD